MWVTLSPCRPASASISRSWPKPRMALSGVRSSWLIRERNSLLARLARSASAAAQPFHLARLLVEEIDDDARHAEEVAQREHHRLRDRHRRLLGDERAVDLVQDAQPLGLRGQRLLRLGVVDGDGGLVGEALQQ